MVTSTQDCVWYYGENKIIKELKEWLERNENNIFIHYTILFCCMLSSDNMKLGLGSEDVYTVAKENITIHPSKMQDNCCSVCVRTRACGHLSVAIVCDDYKGGRTVKSNWGNRVCQYSI